MGTVDPPAPVIKRAHMSADWLAAIVLAGPAAPASAALFCVSTSAQLQSALDIARINGENDVIRVRAGSYEVTGSGFVYESTAMENHDIEISGGWRPYILGPCAVQDATPWTTVLDGNGDTRILSLRIEGSSADARLSRLTFLAGYVGGFNAGALEIHSVGESGGVVVESSAFIANESSMGGGLLIDVRGPKVSVVNNVFVANRALSNMPAASIVNFGGTDNAVVFTNNSIIGNELGNSPVADAAAVYLASPNVIAANNNFWDNDGHDLDTGGSGVRSIFSKGATSTALAGRAA